MKILFSILFTAILCATASAQSIRALSYNTSNNAVIAATNSTNALTFSNAFAWSTNTLAAATRTNLAMPWSGLTNTNTSGFRSALELSAAWLTNTNVTNFRSAVGLGLPALTNTNVSSFLDAIKLGSQATVTFNEVTASSFYGNVYGALSGMAGGSIRLYNTQDQTNEMLSFDPDNYGGWFVSNSTGFRSAIGLPLSALTNTSNITAMRALAGSTNTNEPYSGTVSLTNTNTLTFSNGVLLKIQ